jgi:KEOPS complex subunit Pcc1
MTSYPHSAEIEVETPNAERVYWILHPEVNEEISERSTVELFYEGNKLRILIKSRDLVSLRASFNTWGRLLNIALQILEE